MEDQSPKVSGRGQSCSTMPSAVGKCEGEWQVCDTEAGIESDFVIGPLPEFETQIQSPSINLLLYGKGAYFDVNTP